MFNLGVVFHLGVVFNLGLHLYSRIKIAEPVLTEYLDEGWCLDEPGVLVDEEICSQGVSSRTQYYICLFQEDLEWSFVL